MTNKVNESGSSNGTSNSVTPIGQVQSTPVKPHVTARPVIKPTSPPKQPAPLGTAKAWKAGAAPVKESKVNRITVDSTSEIIATKYPYAKRVMQIIEHRRPSKAPKAALQDMAKGWINDAISEALDSENILVSVSKYGNIFVDVPSWSDNGKERVAHETLFTCHLDTVHGGNKTAVQTLELDVATHSIHLPDATKSSCLGADDGAGIAILLHMIAHGVRGLYAFFLDEEVGGLGSRAFADVGGCWVQGMYHQLDKIQRAIAFDRKGTTDVITMQRHRTCCSDEFAKDLAEALNDNGEWRPNVPFAFTGSPNGSFTDTANLTHIVPECTNLSVGYYDQHTTRERLNMQFLDSLMASLLFVDWDALATKRDPTKQPPRQVGGAYNSGGFGAQYDDTAYWNRHDEKSHPRPAKAAQAEMSFEDRWIDYELSGAELAALIAFKPDKVIQLLTDLGCSFREVQRSTGLKPEDVMKLARYMRTTFSI